jgi:upstream activation factor subunit UAF30
MTSRKILNKVEKANTITNDGYDDILQVLDTMKKQIQSLTSTVKQLQKVANKKNKPSNIKSGFMKPVRISEKLHELIGTNKNELVARNVVNKKVAEYIQNNGLQKPDEKQVFIIDDKLSDLFGLEKNTELRFFKIQSYLKYHYPDKIQEYANQTVSV